MIQRKVGTPKILHVGNTCVDLWNTEGVSVYLKISSHFTNYRPGNRCPSPRCSYVVRRMRHYLGLAARALSFQRGGVVVPGHPARTCRRLDLEPNTLSADPVPLFLPTRRERDFPSERFLAEQVGNHRFCRSEITGCAPLDALPTHSKLLGRSRPRRPYLHQAPLPPRNAAGLRGLRGFRAVRKAHPQRTVVGVHGCQGKVLFLRLKRRPAQRSAEHR